MIKPITVQPINLLHVVQGSDSICKIHIPAPKSGTNGTQGVLNGRFRFGSVLLNTIIEIHTIENAISVPIDTNSLKT